MFVTVNKGIRGARSIRAVVRHRGRYVPFLYRVYSIVQKGLLAATNKVASAVRPRRSKTFLPIFRSQYPSVRPRAVLIEVAIVPIRNGHLLITMPSRTLTLQADETVNATTTSTFPFVDNRKQRGAFNFNV